MTDPGSVSSKKATVQQLAGASAMSVTSSLLAVDAIEAGHAGVAVAGSTVAQSSDAAGGIAEKWAPWLIGSVLAVLCLVVVVARGRRRRKARRAAELAWSRRGVIGWSNVRKPGLSGFQPETLSPGHRPLPQLSVRIPDPSAQSPAWLGAGVTVHHDTARASLTYHMKGLPVTPNAAPKALQPVAVAAPEMPEGQSVDPLAESVWHLSAVATAPRHVMDEPAREQDEAGERTYVSPPENLFGELATVTVENTASISTEAASESIDGDRAVEAASQFASSEQIATPLEEAKRLLALSRPRDAIAALQPLLSSSEMTGEAWMVCGWARWRMANDRGEELENARDAAHAFELALKAEPQRIELLSRMIGRCHMLCAQQSNGQERVNSLEQAVHALRHARIGGRGDRSIDLELADALYERAMVSPQLERASWLDRVQHLIDSLPAHEGIQQGWLQANTLWARAEIVDSRTAQTLHERAFALVQSYLPNLDDTHRDAWLTRLIDGERAHLQRISRAARVTRLHQLQPAIQVHLDGAASIAPLLSWISVLGDWADSLQGAAAAAKLDETEALFARIQTMVPESSGSLNFAKAYYMRLRAQRELSKSGQDAALRQAEQLLERISGEQVPLALVQMESAEIHLARARLAEGKVADAHYAEAAALGAAAAQAPENEARALSCALTALVALQSHRRDEARVATMRPLATRLLSLTPSDARALRLMAWVDFFSGEYGQASEFCNAAWNAGAHRSDILPIWQQADTLWARQLDEPDQHPQWKRLHQRMRMANSTS